jgi:uncharacterized protein YndB with AHSA1/START domain
MIFVWLAFGVLVLLAAAALLLHLKGRTLPVEHTAFAVMQLNNTPEEVWAVIADASRQPEWFKGVNKVERLPDRNGHTVWKQQMGRNSFTLEETVHEPPRRLVREITDLKGPFSGSWEFLLIPVPSKDPARPSDVKVRITERGKVDIPIARAVMAMFGEDMYLKKFLSALAKKFGQTAAFSND